MLLKRKTKVKKKSAIENVSKHLYWEEMQLKLAEYIKYTLFSKKAETVHLPN